MSALGQRAAPFLRATVLGTSRNADLVLPTDQPVASFVPQLLDLLGEPHRLGRYDVVTPDGVVLDPERPLRETALVDGVELRVVVGSEVPPAPLVYDVVEVAEGAAPPGRWSPATRRWVFAGVGAVVLAAAVLLAVRSVDRDDLVVWGSVLVAAVASALLARVAAELAWALGGLALLLAALRLLLGPEPPGSDLVLWGAVAALALGTAGWCSGRLVPAAVAVLLLAAAGVATWGVAELTGDALLTAGVVATAALVALGTLPRLALAASGVLGADTAVVSGRPVRVREAGAAVARAHGTLLGGVGVLALVEGVAAHRLAALSGLEVWPTALAVLVSAALVLRARHFPLALQRAALWVAAAPGPYALTALVVERHPGLTWVATGAVAVAGVLLLAVGLTRPSDVLAARGRRTATRLEGLVVLATLPVLLGCFGVYSDLLDSFG